DEIKAVKKQLAAVRKHLKTLQTDFVERLQQACLHLDDGAARDLVLVILKGELQAIIEGYVARHRALVLDAFETWWDKYQVTLGEIEHSRDAATGAMHGFLVELGYAN